jgi:tetratricopeptide (TPR) repeat protein
MDRGAAYSAKGGYERAIRDFNKVIRLNPDSSWACNNLAWILATCPELRIRDGAEAVRLAERGCKLTDNRAPELLDTLAVAYAELGDFEKAIKAAEKAVQLSLDGGKGELAKDIQSRLKLYKAKHPYHE